MRPAREEAPYELNGEVWHRRYCGECAGTGVVATRACSHGINCPCGTVERECFECDDSGLVVDEKCECSGCCHLRGVLLDKEEVARIQRLADVATMKWAGEAH